MKKLIIALVITTCITTSIYAQRGDTIYKSLGTFTGGATGTVGPVPNIGQVYHQLMIVFSNQPGQTCLGSAVSAAILLGSYDNSVFINMSGNLVSSNAALARTYDYYGAFPFVKVTVSWADTIHCKATVNYIGSLYPPPQLIHAKYPDDGGGLLLFQAHNLPQGDTVIVSAATATVPVVDGILISNQTAAQNLTFTCVDQHNVFTFIAYEFYALGAGQQLNIGFNGSAGYLPIVDCSYNGYYGANGFSNDGMSLKVTLANATPLDLSVYYHYK